MEMLTKFMIYQEEKCKRDHKKNKKAENGIKKEEEKWKRKSEEATQKMEEMELQQREDLKRLQELMKLMTQNDDIEHYLTTFEGMAKTCKWPEVKWVVKLVAHLTAKA